MFEKEKRFLLTFLKLEWLHLQQLQLPRVYILAARPFSRQRGFLGNQSPLLDDLLHIRYFNIFFECFNTKFVVTAG
jgi:hypothetical protein